MTTEPAAVGILRRCRRCFDYRSIDQFAPLGKVCQRCVLKGSAHGHHARIRGYALTPKARAYLNEGRVVAA